MSTNEWELDQEYLDMLDARANSILTAQREFRRNLVNMRKIHKLSQAEVANRMNVSQPTVHDFERYDSNPTMSTIRRYAMAVGARIKLAVIDDETDYMNKTGAHAREPQIANLVQWAATIDDTHGSYNAVISARGVTDPDKVQTTITLREKTYDSRESITTQGESSKFEVSIWDDEKLFQFNENRSLDYSTEDQYA